MIAIVAALILQDPYAQFGRLVALAPPFDHVDLGEWTYQATGSDNSFVILTRPARARGQIWVRYEYAADPGRTILSERDLVEINCAEWKTRKLQVDLFAESNLNGVPEGTNVPGSWSVAAPDTVAEITLEAACGD